MSLQSGATLTPCRTIKPRLAHCFSSGNLYSIVHFSYSRPLLRASEKETYGIWQKYSIVTTFTLLSDNLRVLFQRIWVHSSCWFDPCVYRLEASRESTRCRQSCSGYSLTCCIFYPSCVQCMAGLVFISSNGFHHNYASRQLFNLAGWLADYGSRNRDCSW